jgi:Holliday junction DNA helicase RuvA
MIDYIEGEIAELSDEMLVLDTEGMGFQLLISRATRDSLKHREGPVKVFVYLHVREDDLSLYGFSTLEERKLFRLLISVSGVGPKGALAMLSHVSPQRFQEAVLGERRDLLEEVKGIGRKTAERLIVELREKIGKISFGPEPIQQFSNREDMAFRALTRNLGFSESEARRAIAQAKASGVESTEELIKRAITMLAGR